MIRIHLTKTMIQTMKLKLLSFKGEEWAESLRYIIRAEQEGEYELYPFEAAKIAGG